IFFSFVVFFFFFFNDTATTEIYTLSLHDALPICGPRWPSRCPWSCWPWSPDRKSTRLNSSHDQISYAVFCLKKKKKNNLYYISYDITTKIDHNKINHIYI